MSSRIANYFVTLRTNDQCEFGHLWDNREYQRSQDQERFEPRLLTDLRRAGVKQLKITGGEPLLRPDLPEILKAAKQLGFTVELTTNGILYEEQAGLLDGLIDRLLFFLDHPMAGEHDRSRGVECFNAVTAAIRKAKDPWIKFVMTRESVRFLPEMVELAEHLRVRLELEPVADFYGTQGFEPATIAHIKYYSKRPNIRVNLAALELSRLGGNGVLFPRCRARETTVTALPDGQLVSPCFYNQKGTQGRADICSGCMRWEYMLPSFSVGLDRFYWLNLWSEWKTRRNLT